MKNNFSLLILLTLLTACQPGPGGNPSGKGSPTTSGPRQGNNGGQPGPADTGGANGTRGKLFEGYNKKIEDLSLFKDSISLILNKVARVLPELAGEMLYVLREKSWMFLPVSLDQIPNDFLGVHIKHEVVNQFALQDLQEVYVDQKLFDEMNLKDQTILMVHEMMMGVRQMEFASKKNNCIAEATRFAFKNPGKYKEERYHCNNTVNEIASGLEDHFKQKTFTLHKEDYKQIRQMTVKIMSDIENMDANELKTLVYENLKRRY